MSLINSFRAVSCSGAFIPDARAVTAMALLFERVFLPNNIEIVAEFAKKYRFQDYRSRDIGLRVEGDDDPFSELTEEQRQTANRYLQVSLGFLVRNRELVGPLFETDLVERNEDFGVKLIKQGGPGEKSTYSVKPSLTLVSDADNMVSTLINRGYFPLATAGGTIADGCRPIARELASLLAMKSVEMALPAVAAAKAEEILEARERLRDHLPLFWASMLRLSSELSKRIAENATSAVVLREADDLVDTIVRPGAIELGKKLEKERKGWFRRILGPAQQSLKLICGRPGMTKQDLITAALLLSADITTATVEKMRDLSSLRNDSGLTYLIELEKTLTE